MVECRDWYFIGNALIGRSRLFFLRMRRIQSGGCLCNFRDTVWLEVQNTDGGVLSSNWLSKHYPSVRWHGRLAKPRGFTACPLIHESRKDDELKAYYTLHYPKGAGAGAGAHAGAGRADTTRLGLALASNTEKFDSLTAVARAAAEATEPVAIATDEESEGEQKGGGARTRPCKRKHPEVADKVGVGVGVGVDDEGGDDGENVQCVIKFNCNVLLQLFATTHRCCKNVIIRHSLS